MGDDGPPDAAIRRALRDSIAASAVSLSTIGQAISMAVLIFSGAIQEGLPRAISNFVIAGGVVSIYIGAQSRIVPVGAVIQDSPTIVMVAVAGSIAATGTSTAVSDVFVTLAATCALAGAAMWLLGRARLGALVKYMPTTVVGAFMGGTGWLLAKGGLDVAVGYTVELGNIAELFSTDVAKFWVPGVTLGVLVWLIGRSDLPAILMSATIAASLAAFYVVVAAVSSLGAVETGGWLIGPFPSDAGPSLVTPSEVADSAWSGILTEIPGILSVVAVAIMVLLLNVTALGMQSTDRVDADLELRTAGIANMACSPLGVVPGFHGLAHTTLIRQLGSTGRLVPLLIGGLMIGFGALGVGLIGSIPRLVVSAMLITVGLALLADWIVDLVRSVSIIEQFLSVGIVVVIGAVGILEGIAVGLFSACAVFIVRYSRVDPVRLAGTGRDVRSRVDRSPGEFHALRQRDEQLTVLELQGYLFFGSVTSIEDRIRATIESAGEDPLDAVVLDFRTVTGIDTSGYVLIGAAVDDIGSHGTLVVMSSVADSLRESLIAAEPEAFHDVTWAPTLDDALEATERLQLQRAGSVGSSATDQHLELSAALLAEFEERRFEAGELVMDQGSESEGMFVLIEGSMTALRIDESGARHRLSRFGRGALVGEIGLITGGPRTATIVAESDAVTMWLSAHRYRALRQEGSELAFELHEYIMRSQAERVISLSEGLARSLR